MSDLERLTEALAEWSHSYLSLEPVLAAARAYRDLLANGERVWRCERNWRGGEKLCREVHAYEPTLHVICGWHLIVPIPVEPGEET